MGYGLTTYAEKKILDHRLKVASYTPVQPYLALFTSSPGEAGSLAGEPGAGLGYARKQITFAAASARSITQTGDVTFDQATSGWGDITHWGLCDGATRGAGNVLAYGAFAATKTVVTGNTPSVVSGQIVVSQAAGAMFTAMVTLMLDWLLRLQAWAQPTNVKIGLSTTIPTDGGPNITEPAGNAYAQVTLNTWNAGSSADPTLCDNNGAITFPTPTPAGWGTIVYAVVYGDTNPTWYGDITDQAVGAGDTVQFATGALDITQQ